MFALTQAGVTLNAPLFPISASGFFTKALALGRLLRSSASPLIILACFEEDASSSGRLLFTRPEGSAPLDNTPGCITEVEASIEGDGNSFIPESLQKDDGELTVRTDAVAVRAEKLGFASRPLIFGMRFVGAAKFC
ncbi:MAG: hypothetical protein C5B47_01495 [Verrucomicrobia bacterium]|nr:MAG: hypothetical protein C5B47_01495 [Verrucomicrobiota bacterium]